jgi:flagellar FliL protein
MSSKTAAPAAAETGDAPPKKKGKLVLFLAAVAVLVTVPAGLWFTGILPKLLSMGPKTAPGKTAATHAAAGSTAPATYLDVPEIITNLNVPGRRQSYLKLHAKLELGGASDVAPVTAAMPRILDLFQTYLRDMRPEELRGSEGSYRLREELVGRASVAVAPAQIRAVLFQEFIIQ